MGGRAIPARRARTVCLLLAAAALCGGAGPAKGAEPSDLLERALDHYRDVEDYIGNVATYDVASPNVSDSELDRRPPLLTFRIYYRDGKHTVRPVALPPDAGMFRVELLSALHVLHQLEVTDAGSERLDGAEYGVREVTSPDRTGSKAVVWIDSRQERVARIAFFLADVEYAITEFRYSAQQAEGLPVQTRTVFPTSGEVLINRISEYQINAGVDDDVFEEAWDGEVR